MKTEAQKRAEKKYRATTGKDNVAFLRIDLRRTTDADIIEHLGKQSNKAGYIKSLIRADMARRL